jgi:predicted nuclease of restriction endonuclease-like (RecB) superfamily
MSKQNKNKLKQPEQIGKGVNNDLMSKALEARRALELKDDVVTFKLEKSVHQAIINKTLEMGVSKSFLIQELIKNFLKQTV